MSCLETGLETGLDCLSLGLNLVFVQEGQKKPVDYDWGNKRPTESDLRTRCGNNPNLNLGVQLGRASGVIALDQDTAKAIEDRAALFAGCDNPVTVEWLTKRGRQELFAWDERLAQIGKAKFYFGSLEVRLGIGKAAQSLLPPSTTDGYSRQWVHDLSTPIAKLPDIVIERLIEAAKKPSAEPKPKPAVKDKLESDFCDRGDWRQILESHNWRYLGTTDVGEQYTRPGKDSGVSAAVVKADDGRELLHVFTNNAPPFEADKNYNKLRAYSLLNHKGDDKAARTELAREGYGEFIDYGWITSDELDANDYTEEFLIENTLVAGQPMLFAGPAKGLKTGLEIDMAVSLASGTPFMRKLAVTRAVRVGVMSGESGMATMKKTARKVCAAAGIKFSTLKDKLIWSSKLPRFDDGRYLASIDRDIKAKGIEVLFIDPLYLAMPSKDANNVFAQGELLRGMNEICQDNGVTLILLHHTKKRNQNNVFAVPELTDMTWAGFAEFARQWILINRRSPFDPDGVNELWLSIGGSAGHSSRWAADIDERDEQWKVTLSTSGEAKAAKKENGLRQRIADSAREFKHPEGKTNILDGAGLKNNARAKPVFDAMVRDGELVAAKYERNGTEYDGYTLAL